MRRPTTLAGCMLAAALAIAGCAEDPFDQPVDAQPDATPTASATPEGRVGPVSFDNCGEQVTLDAVPERVVILSGNAVPLLSAVDALDRVVARGGDFSADLYEADIREAVEAIPVLSEEKGETGGVVFSLEVLLDQDPDLVIGYQTQTITRAALDDAGIPLIVQPGFCDGATEPDVDFTDVYDEVELYGRIFDAGEAATAAIDDLRERVDAVGAAASPAPDGGPSVALLYLTESGGALSAYGNRGIVHDQVELAGLSNVFADVDKRVFDVGVEELLGRDPDVVIILRAVDADAEVLIDALRGLPGAGELRAIREDAVTTQIFDYGDPPTPLSVEGLELLAEQYSPE